MALPAAEFEDVSSLERSRSVVMPAQGPNPMSTGGGACRHRNAAAHALCVPRRQPRTALERGQQRLDARRRFVRAPGLGRHL